LAVFSELTKNRSEQGPIYIQGAGGLLLVAGFVNYFAFGNANGLSSTMWSSR